MTSGKNLKHLKILRKATARIEGGQRKLIRVIDLSRDSLGIETDTPFKPGVTIEIEMGLPIEKNLVPIKVQGKTYLSHLSKNAFYTRVHLSNQSLM